MLPYAFFLVSMAKIEINLETTTLKGKNFGEKEAAFKNYHYLCADNNHRNQIFRL